MAARNDAGANSLRYPDRHNVIANLSFNAHEIAGPHGKPFCMRWMNPERIRVRDLVQPLRVCAARVNLHGETEGGDQNRLALFQIVLMNVAFEIYGYREFRPAPAAQS